MGQALELLRKSRIRVVGRKYSPARLVRFLDTLSNIPVLAEACRQAGFSPTSAKYYLAKSENGDPGFLIQWGDVEGPFHELYKIALETGTDRVEANAFKRANGYNEVLTHQGRVQYEIDHDAIALGAEPGSWDAIKKDAKGKPIPCMVEKQSEDLMQFILKARRPDIYGNKSQVDMIMRGGVMVVSARAKTSAELLQRAKKLNEAVDVDFIEIDDEADAAQTEANLTSGEGGEK